TVQHLRLDTVTRPLFGAPLRELQRLAGMRALYPSGPPPRHVHAMALDQPEHHVGSAAGKADQALAVFGPIHLEEIIGIVLESGNHLPAIAPRPAKADFPGFEQHGVDAAFGPVQLRAQPGIPASDDAYGGAPRPLQLRGFA